jgi:hypothetical protein
MTSFRRGGTWSTSRTTLGEGRLGTQGGVRAQSQGTLTPTRASACQSRDLAGHPGLDLAGPKSCADRDGIRRSIKGPASPAGRAEAFPEISRSSSLLSAVLEGSSPPASGAGAEGISPGRIRGLFGGMPPAGEARDLLQPPILPCRLVGLQHDRGRAGGPWGDTERRSKDHRTVWQSRPKPTEPGGPMCWNEVPAEARSTDRRTMPWRFRGTKTHQRSRWASPASPEGDIGSAHIEHPCRAGEPATHGR